MYETVKPFSHPAFEARVAKTVAARMPADYDHSAEVARLEPLDLFHDRYRGSDVGANRVLLERHAATMLRAQLVAAHAKGETPSTSIGIPWDDIAEILLGPWCNPNGVALLVGKLSNAVAEDEAELVRTMSALETARPDHAEVFPLVHRQVTIENRLPDRKRALEAFRTGFPRAIAAAVGDQTEQLVTGLAETRALAGLVPTIAEGGIVAAIAEVDQQLAQLGTVNVKGPSTARLEEERKGLTARLEALRSEHSAAVVAGIRAEVDRLMAGSLDAYATVWKAVFSHPTSFPTGFGDRLAGAGLAAVTGSDPQLFSRILESRDHREF